MQSCSSVHGEAGARRCLVAAPDLGAGVLSLDFHKLWRAFFEQGFDSVVFSRALWDDGAFAYPDAEDIDIAPAFRALGRPRDDGFVDVGEERAELLVAGLGGRCVEPAVANAHEAAREHVLQEAAEELVSAESGLAGLFGFAVAPADGDAVLVCGEDAGVVECVLLHVSGEVGDCLFAAADCLQIDDPFAAPCGFGDCGEGRLERAAGRADGGELRVECIAPACAE